MSFDDEMVHFAALQARRQSPTQQATDDLIWAIKLIERAGDLVWTDADKDRYWGIKKRLMRMAHKDA